MTIKKIKVRETAKYYNVFQGSLEDIMASLQVELDSGWEGIECDYEYDYGGDKYTVYKLYKHRDETDQEYNKRMKQLEKAKEEKVKAKERKFQQLKKDLASLSDADKKLLGL